ncbi:hypothetical protein Y032_0003g1607 [Ancylostoma ceylanicum]|uniref:Secreted protein n=1 Tax=Ancylostoma ceylanicum TaxID=53326 RepID=A0A016VY25_9BILA|nr:hypothetical protein Y032_0003g1607 [Ancylostoma ceylanicum]
MGAICSWLILLPPVCACLDRACQYICYLLCVVRPSNPTYWKRSEFQAGREKNDGLPAKKLDTESAIAPTFTPLRMPLRLNTPGAE